MTLKELLDQISKEYSEIQDSLSKKTRFDAVEADVEFHDAETKFSYFKTLAASKIPDPEPLYKRIFESAPEAIRNNSQNALVLGKVEFLLHNLPEDNPNFGLVERIHNASKKPDKNPGYIEQLDLIANDGLSENEYEEYKKVNFLNFIPNAFVTHNIEHFSSLIMEFVPEEDGKEIVAESETYIKVSKLPKELATTPICAELIPGLTERAETEEEREALRFISENVVIANKKYSQFLFNRNQKIMDMMTKEDIIIREQYFEKHPEYKDTFMPGMSLGMEVVEEKRKEFEDIYNGEYQISEKTSNAMAEIMHKLDEMKVIDESNIIAAEEGVKKYGMASVSNAMEKIENAMTEGRIHDLPALTEEYKLAKQNCDELLNIARENFGNNPLLYGANVDVARTDKMPVEYRLACREVSQVSELLNCLKICKIYNFKIDDFVKAPNHYMSIAREQMLKKYDINETTKNLDLGEKLFVLDNPLPIQNYNPEIGISGLIMRAEEGFKGFEPDPEKTLHNSNIALFNNDIKFSQGSAHLNIKYLSKNAEETISNMLLFDSKKTIQELTADPNSKYDLRYNKNYPMLDANAHIKETDIDYALLGNKMKEMYKGYVTQCLVNKITPKANTVNAIKNVVAKIEKIKPEEAEKQEFKELKEFSSKFTHVVKSAKRISEIIDGENQPLSERSKAITLNRLSEKRTNYREIGGATRFFSYFPFINNSATKLRRSIEADKKFLTQKGVAKADIDLTLTPENIPEYTEKSIFPERFDIHSIDMRPESEVKPVEELSQMLEKDVVEEQKELEPEIVNTNIKSEIKEVEP